MKIKLLTIYAGMLNLLLGGMSIIFIVGREEFNIIGWILLVIAISTIAFILVASENMKL